MFYFKGRSPLYLILPYLPGVRHEQGVRPLGATYFLLVQKVGKDTFRGENTDSTSGAEKRALAHSIFPLKTPRFTRAQSRSAVF